MNLRLLPIVLLAVGGLLALKSISLLNGGNQSFEAVSTAVAQQTLAENGDLNGVASSQSGESALADVPSSSAEGTMNKEMVQGTDEGNAAQASASEDSMATAAPVVEQEDVMSMTPSQRRVLQSLANRRTELKEREAQYQLREKLLSATEKRLNSRMSELENLKNSIGTAVEKKDDAENKRMAGLVKMYETMKVKEAARIFDRLDMPILVMVVKQMNPRKMAGILGKMSPDAAQRLTVALATGQMAQQPMNDGPTTLPKIEGN
ncbi:MAG: hypothetical protein ABJN26_21825 [Stappiaceae bacterium]